VDSEGRRCTVSECRLVLLRPCSRASVHDSCPGSISEFAGFGIGANYEAQALTSWLGVWRACIDSIHSDYGLETDLIQELRNKYSTYGMEEGRDKFY
jgi:hypothetical protein